MVSIKINGAEKAIKSLEEYANALPSKVDLLLLTLAENAVNTASIVFQHALGGNGVNVYLDKIENGYAVVASGEAVCFIEFGAGVYAQDSIMNPGVEVYPGSWSKDHAQTYQKWEDSGKPMEQYPYNRLPHNAMLQAYNEILRDFDKEARKILK